MRTATLAVLLFCAAPSIAHAQVTPLPFGEPLQVTGSETDSQAVLSERLLAVSKTLLGTRYLYGGTTPSRGFDCSGFVRYVYDAVGIRLPRTANEMSHAGVPVAATIDSVRPGDLLLFSVGSRKVDHVAIYAGDGEVLHATKRGGSVRVDRMRSARGKWLAKHWTGARRVIYAQPLTESAVMRTP